MKLYYSPSSPFVRKCLVAAHELGLRERIELVPGTPHPVNRDAAIVAHNPLGKIPTLIADDGKVLFDSRVICEYLDSLANGGLVPPAGTARWRALTEQSLADGMTDAAVLVRYENAVRPEPLRWADWNRGQLEKVHSGLADIERRAHDFTGRIDIGTVSIACALGYLDFRYADLTWRAHCPRTAGWFEDFNNRPSMVATKPPTA
jgi:glutathione S-transferase